MREKLPILRQRVRLLFLHTQIREVFSEDCYTGKIENILPLEPSQNEIIWKAIEENTWVFFTAQPS